MRVREQKWQRVQLLLVHKSFQQNSAVWDQEHMTRSSRKTQGKVKRVREWSTSENFAETKESRHNREGGNRCNQDGSKMLQNKESTRGHSEGKEEG